MTVTSICSIYTAFSHSITSSSILITHANTSLIPAPLCHLPKSFTPHVLPFSSPFVDLALYLPTYSLHSFPILLLHSWAITSLIPTLHISLYHFITPPSCQKLTVGHPVAICRHPVETRVSCRIPYRHPVGGHSLGCWASKHEEPLWMDAKDPWGPLLASPTFPKLSFLPHHICTTKP